jgi:endonuclease/exonuclease/phosphatase family metal-dependent hydrolase
VGTEDADLPSPASRDIVVLTWNLAFAYGRGSEGARFFPRGRVDFERNLDRIAEVIRGSEADVVLLQEVDFGSKRSHRMDQMVELMYRTGYAHGAPALSWAARWVPFPYWPPSRQFGPVRSGGAILSRHPLSTPRVTLFAGLIEQPLWYRPFYPHRYHQRVDVNLGGRVLRAWNLHLEAFKKSARERQARELAAELTSRQWPAPWVVGGDFNTTPPEAKKKSGFEDEPADDYEDDRTLESLRGIQGLRESVPVGDYVRDESRYFTFPSTGPNRRLDYLFASDGLKIKEARVLTDAGPCSDHLPLRVRLGWQS